MKLKKQKAAGLLFGATSLGAALLFIIFSFGKSAASTSLSIDKQTEFSSISRLGDGVSLGNTPVTVPSPAVNAKKGHSSRTSFTSKYIQLVPQLLWVGHPFFCLTKKPLLTVPPMRLHLALRVMRI